MEGFDGQGPIAGPKAGSKDSSMHVPFRILTPTLLMAETLLLTSERLILSFPSNHQRPNKCQAEETSHTPVTRCRVINSAAGAAQEESLADKNKIFL